MATSKKKYKYLPPLIQKSVMYRSYGLTPDMVLPGTIGKPKRIRVKE